MTKQSVRKKVTVNGKEYLLQKLKMSEALNLKGKWINPNGSVNEAAAYVEILKSIVVDPVVTVDDFDDFKELTELVNVAHAFQYGAVTKEEKNE